MHAKERHKRITSSGKKDKVALMGIIERGGEVRAEVIPAASKAALHGGVKRHVEKGTELFTDALWS